MPPKKMPKKDMIKLPKPEILMVKDVQPDERFNDIHPNLPEPPCLCLIVGSVRSGKSNLLVNMFLNEAFYKDKFDVVRIVSTTLGTDRKGQILAEHFDASDHYNDGIIDGIKSEQSKYERENRPSYALVLDDVLTRDFSKSNAVSYFATRYRHYIDLYVITTQSFRAVSGLIRNNANAVMICRQQNSKEIEKIAEEYADSVGGYDNFIKLYKQVHSKPYQIMYIDLSKNPSRVLHNFTDIIWEGEESKELIID